MTTQQDTTSLLPTVASISAEFVDNRLPPAIAAYTAHQKSAPTLRDLAGLDVKDIAQNTLLSGVMATGFDNLIAQLSAHFSGGTTAKIEFNWLNHTPFNTTYHLPELKTDCPTPEVLWRTLVETWKVNLEAIVADLSTQARTLKHLGLKQALQSLRSDLGLAYSESAGRFIKCRRSFYRQSDYDHRQTAAKMMRTLAIVEAETGQHFGTAIQSFADALEGLDYFSTLPSRTVFGKGQAIEIHTFKEHYNVVITRAAFETLAAFCCLNGADEDLSELFASMLRAA